MGAVLQFLSDMCNSAAARALFVTAMLLFAGMLSAQHNSGRDHHVYHPPAEAKHPASAQSSTTRAHATTTATATTAHVSSAAGTQSSALHGPVSTAKPDAVTPLNVGERQPQ